jgi:dUTP pyrophosphatase
MDKPYRLLVQVMKLCNEATLPTYGRRGDAGMDLYALTSGVVPAGLRWIIRTGIALKIPAGYVGLVWGRSGIATNKGVSVLGGVIDSNYIGEVFVTLQNNDPSIPFIFAAGDRIAQLLIQPIYEAVLEEVDKLEPTNRGDGALGSSGK